MEYPALHADASSSSDEAQRIFLLFVRGEYLLILSTSIGYLLLPSASWSHVLLMLFVLGALAVAGYRAWKKPEEDWYQFRALAESVKTLTWRYAMRSDPFEGDDLPARAEFRNALRELLRVNSSLGPKFAHYDPDKAQITEEMVATRALPLEKRKALYLSDRIGNQRSWYAKKAHGNKIASRSWQVTLACVYAAIIAILGVRIALPDWTYLAPDPLLVGASSIIGWMQVKKFTDLAAAYLLTAQEIGIAATEVEEIADDVRWGKFVNACEQVFSREHTQWVARRRS